MDLQLHFVFSKTTTNKHACIKQTLLEVRNRVHFVLIIYSRHLNFLVHGQQISHITKCNVVKVRNTASTRKYIFKHII